MRKETQRPLLPLLLLLLPYVSLSLDRPLLPTDRRGIWILYTEKSEAGCLVSRSPMFKSASSCRTP